MEYIYISFCDYGVVGAYTWPILSSLRFVMHIISYATPGLSISFLVYEKASSCLTVFVFTFV